MHYVVSTGTTVCLLTTGRALDDAHSPDPLLRMTPASVSVALNIPCGSVDWTYVGQLLCPVWFCRYLCHAGLRSGVLRS